MPKSRPAPAGQVASSGWPDRAADRDLTRGPTGCSQFSRTPCHAETRVIARVEPLTTTRRLSGPFDYKVDGDIDVGSLLKIPFGHQKLDGVVTALTDTTDVPEEKLVAPLATRDDTLPRDLVDLALWMAEEYCSTPARALSLVTPPPGKAKTQLWAEATGQDAKVTDKQAALLARLPGPAGADLGALRRLEKRGLVTISARIARRAPRMDVPPDRAHELTQAQADALEAIDAAPGTAHLLHGVTGSGKTEVYLRAAAAALERGEGVIVLVPEIALTPQTVARFAARFGDTVALLHSALSDGERYDEWRRLRTGEARIAVGPRSAVFAPISGLGLIVVDEEHDASYKQEGDPRYDARVVAERRAALEGALLVAGSATPRPESLVRYERLELRERVDGRPLPPVEIVAMGGVSGPLDGRTRQELDGVRRRGEKAIVLLNRRGWSNFLSCRLCGHVWECPHCDVTLVLHQAAGELACHHCGHRASLPSACPECGSVSVARHGAGTEQLERELEAVVSPLPVFRLDSDVAAAAGVATVLRRFDEADAGVLVGTQMVAKGHDFPDVTLGVVLDADATLRFPDFRSEERTFALVAQLAGRSGRGERGGHVVVQALDPSARALRLAAAHDSEGFLEGEIARRRALSYPPFGNLIRIVCLSEEPGPEVEAAAALRALIALPDAQILGPAPLFRLQGRERSQIVVKAADRAAAVVAVRRAVETVAAAP